MATRLLWSAGVWGGRIGVSMPGAWLTIPPPPPHPLAPLGAPPFHPLFHLGPRRTGSSGDRAVPLPAPGSHGVGRGGRGRVDPGDQPVLGGPHALANAGGRPERPRCDASVTHPSSPVPKGLAPLSSQRAPSLSCRYHPRVLVLSLGSSGKPLPACPTGALWTACAEW